MSAIDGVYPVVTLEASCMDGRNWSRHPSPMPAITLTDEELQSAAMAARAARAIAETDAARNGNPDVRAGFEASARRYKELAEKLERARKA